MGQGGISSDGDSFCRQNGRKNDYGQVEPNRTNVLEFGCGVGRFLKPLACRFRLVCGVDISEAMFKSAKEYCSCLPNITLQQTPGQALADSFLTYPMTSRRWMEGVYDDIRTRTQMHERQAKRPLTMTFYND